MGAPIRDLEKRRHLHPMGPAVSLFRREQRVRLCLMIGRDNNTPLVRLRPSLPGLLICTHLTNQDGWDERTETTRR